MTRRSTGRRGKETGRIQVADTEVESLEELRKKVEGTVALIEGGVLTIFGQTPSWVVWGLLSSPGEPSVWGDYLLAGADAGEALRGAAELATEPVSAVRITVGGTSRSSGRWHQAAWVVRLPEARSPAARP